jgi:DNA-directed RNA polymerase alpha subunit
MASYHRLIEQQRAAPPMDARRNGAVPALGATVAKTPFDVCVDDLNLSVRASNALRNEKIITVGDLVERSRESLLAMPNFGRVSLAEVESALAKLQLHLGMQHPDWDRRRDIIAA